MSFIVGKYQHERNENLDEYYKATGVPFIPRKMMLSSSPSMEVTADEQGEWTFTVSSLIRTHVVKFKLGEEYEESMPGNVVIKNITTKEGENTFVTVSTGPDGKKSTRTYEFSENGLIIILKHLESGVEAKRYFKRV